MRILLVDQDKDFLKVLATVFQVYRPGYFTYAVSTARECLAHINSNKVDLVILDTTLPDMSGFEVCRILRDHGDVAVIFLTESDQEEKVLCGFQTGADDYVKKPFRYRELVARVDAVLRRSGQSECRGEPSNCGIGDLQMDFAKREITVGGQPIHLTMREWEVLCMLASNQGRVVTAQQMLRKVWGPEYMGEIHYLKTFVYRLRKKIEKEPANPSYILTEHGIGYLLAGNERSIPGQSK